MPTLSIIIPVYNEQANIAEVVRRVLAVQLPDGLGRELILVDDCSTDQSWPQMQALPADHPQASIRLLRHPVNHGKGAALRSGLEAANGDIMLIQDADLEYDPADYPKLLAPILAGQADVVYGSRFRRGEAPGQQGQPSRRSPGRWVHYLGNRMLTGLSNLMTGLRLTDMETCYKVFHRQVVRSFTIASQRFEVEPELTARVARGGWRLVEVPISYTGRSYAEGKKITWRDGLKAIATILRYRLFD